MKINQLNNFNFNPEEVKKTRSGELGKFKNVLSDFVGNVNSDQLNAKDISTEFVLGGDVELHDVMIAGEKAKTSLELLMEIRNKAVDMYKELNRMQQ